MVGCPVLRRAFKTEHFTSGIFCYRCSSQTRVLPKYGSQPVRVCDGCASAPADQSPPQENPLISSSMLRSSLFTKFDEEPIAVWVQPPNPIPYGTSPPPPSVISPKEFFLDQDMDLKTLSEIEAEKESALKEAEEKRQRKAEKQRLKERKHFVAGEKERLNAEKQHPKHEERQNEKTTTGQVDNEREGTPPSVSDAMFAGLSLTESIELHPAALASLQSASENIQEGSSGSPNTPMEGNEEEKTAEINNVGPHSTRSKNVRSSSKTQRETVKEAKRRHAHPRVADNSLWKKAQEFAIAFYCGLRDSLQLKYTFLTLWRSNTAFYRSVDVFVSSISFSLWGGGAVD